MIRNALTLALVAGVAGTAGAATNDLVASFGFTDLDGSYIGDINGGTFTANASGSGTGGTAGDVTRLLGLTSSTADFDANFADDADESDVFITLSVVNIGGDLTGSGSFNITDTDGDILQGELNGSWQVGAFGFVFFNGMIDIASFQSDGDAGEGLTFDGPNGGSFEFGDLQVLQLNGAFSILFRNAFGFDDAFQGVTVQADGLLVPTPATAVIGLAGLATMTRRRRA